MRLRGPCRIAIRTEGGTWVSRLAAGGARRSLQARLPDADVDMQPGDGPWDLELTLSGGADDPLGLVARYGVPPEVLRKRRTMAEIVGWLPSGTALPKIVTTVGVDERWVAGLADTPAAAGAYILRVDVGEQPAGSVLPVWASDSDRAAVCSAADVMIIGSPHLGATAFASGLAIFCGSAEDFPPWAPRELIAETPSELADLLGRALSGNLPPFAHGADLEGRLDELAASAADAAFARAPEDYRRWATGTAELADDATADLEKVRSRRRGDRAILGETAHRLAYAEEQYGHCDYARAQAEEELLRLRRSRPVRWADRLARLMRA